MRTFWGLSSTSTAGLPSYEIPLVLLARLAVDHRFAGRGLGHALISEALRVSLSVSEQVGCRGIVVEAYPTAIKWLREVRIRSAF